MVYMDYTDCRDSIHMSELSLPGGTPPLGAEIHQLVFNFNCLPLRDMYFVKYTIINKSSLTWDSTYISNLNDPDLGNAGDDSFGCDSSKNLGFTYNNDNSDYDYGTNPPAIGVRFLQTPLIYTGSNNDTARLPYDTLIGYKMTGMSGFNGFLGGGNECSGDPDQAILAYNFMRGKDGCGNPIINWVTGQQTRYRYSGDACTKTGWYDSLPGDKRTIMNMGPITINSGDTQIVLLNYMITRNGGTNNQNVCALRSVSDSALKYYFADFRTCLPIGIEPISTEIPQKFELFQNYPNPFNPMTRLKFQMPKSGFTKLVVFDVTGKEKSILVNENLKPGIYEIDWNAENIPSGVYFYSLITNEFTQTKKMVVLK